MGESKETTVELTGAWYGWHILTCAYSENDKYKDESFIKAAGEALERERKAGNLHEGDHFHFGCNPKDRFVFVSGGGVKRGFRPVGKSEEKDTSYYSVLHSRDDGDTIKVEKPATGKDARLRFGASEDR